MVGIKLLTAVVPGTYQEVPDTWYLIPGIWYEIALTAAGSYQSLA